VTQQHRALRDGVHQHRLSSGGGAGVYAFSRLDRTSGQEYVVALNNSEQPRTAFVPTAAGHGAPFALVYGEAAPGVATDPGARLPVTVPPLSTVVYHSQAPIPASPAAPAIRIAPLPEGGDARDRTEVGAFVDGSSFYDVTFQAKVGNGGWTPIGTDDNAPYRVFHDVAGLDPGTEVSYRAVLLDNAGNTRTSDVKTATVAPPSITLTSPPDCTGVRETASLTAEAVPNRSHYAVTFERSVNGGPWTARGTDDSQPAYSFSDDVAGLAAGDEVRYRARLGYGAGTVTSAERAATVTEPVSTTTIHYQRTDGNYAGWGLHLWGDGLAPGEATASWDNPTEFEGTDSYGAFHVIDVADDTKQVGFVVHGQPPNHDTKDPNGSPDRFFTPSSSPEIWLKQGDPTIYTCGPPG
jgi:hypothetical protein